MIFVNRIYAIVGMAGSGKSIACDVLKDMGWKYIRFGQVTIDRLEAEGKAVTEESEKKMREAPSQILQNRLKLKQTPKSQELPWERCDLSIS